MQFLYVDNRFIIQVRYNVCETDIVNVVHKGDMFISVFHNVIFNLLRDCNHIVTVNERSRIRTLLTFEDYSITRRKFFRYVKLLYLFNNLNK